ncbi:MAG: hypothetical protein KBT87_10920 [Gammaproteobacteria bacterium]|jgi:hypothetical protein|nr:hypothetical protein [Gammaproteobacteria bacterium]MBQ0775175.1 hypothetical protein [Gammaproteobacteria bacterium]|tara:strand:+ start:14366 stop:14695 length:330 start_codon:yes stop_codon:yes gene_type:complete
MAVITKALQTIRLTRIATVSIVAWGLLPLSASALEMNAEQYIEYMAHQHCANQQYWEQPEQLERTLNALDQQYSIGDDDFDALDDMAMKFAEDPNNQAALETKVHAICP